MSEIGEEIVDGKNGVVCWFYVYKNDHGKQYICGIVIIKQLTADDEGSSSSLQENKKFFYTETKLECLDGAFHACSYTYKNNQLINDFIHTKPTQEVIKKFERKENKFIIMDYTELHFFLDVAINKNFNIFDNWLDDDDSISYVAKIRHEFSRSISNLQDFHFQ
jgi:hypothetical protein